jgi:hypothetical protein
MADIGLRLQHAEDISVHLIEIVSFHQFSPNFELYISPAIIIGSNLKGNCGDCVLSFQGDVRVGGEDDNVTDGAEADRTERTG